MEGYRNLMQEMGLMQDGPTVIWQDNQAAIQIAMNRGALAKKTRAMDMRVMTIRNKIEDVKVFDVPAHLRNDCRHRHQSSGPEALHLSAG